MLINISGAARESSPASDTFSLIDLWLLTCTIFVALALFEYAIVIKIRYNSRRRNNDKNRYKSRGKRAETNIQRQQNRDKTTETREQIQESRDKKELGRARKIKKERDKKKRKRKKGKEKD